MCVYDRWIHEPHPQFGDVCHVVFRHPAADGSLSGYSLQEYPLPHPFRFGAQYKGPDGRLCPTFIEIEEAELEEEIETELYDCPTEMEIF